VYARGTSCHVNICMYIHMLKKKYTAYQQNITAQNYFSFREIYFFAGRRAGLSLQES